MKLKINTSQRHQVEVYLDQEKFTSSQRASQELLPLIKKALREKGAVWEQINEIEVFTGPGSFTGLRVGVAVANILAWALKIKVNRQSPPVFPRYRS